MPVSHSIPPTGVASPLLWRCPSPSRWHWRAGREVTACPGAGTGRSDADGVHSYSQWTLNVVCAALTSQPMSHSSHSPFHALHCCSPHPAQKSQDTSSCPVNIPPLQQPGCLHPIPSVPGTVGCCEQSSTWDQQTPQRRQQPARLCLWPPHDLNTAVSCHYPAAGGQHQCRPGPCCFGLLQ